MLSSRLKSLMRSEESSGEWKQQRRINRPKFREGLRIGPRSVVDLTQQVFINPGKGDKQKQPTPNSHEDGKEHGASVVKQMGHLEAQAHKKKRDVSKEPAVRQQRQHCFRVTFLSTWRI